MAKASWEFYRGCIVAYNLTDDESTMKFSLVEVPIIANLGKEASEPGACTPTAAANWNDWKARGQKANRSRPITSHCSAARLSLPDQSVQTWRSHQVAKRFS